MQAPTLSPDLITDAARRLTDARLAIELIDDLGAATPIDPTSALAIAEEHAVMLGWDTVGWKVGCTSEEAMEILQSPGPFPGRVFDGTVYGSGVVHEHAMHNPGLECEFAFILGQDLGPADDLYTVDDVQRATKAVAPAIELVAPRLRDFTGVGYLSLMADSGANGGVVLGEPIPVDQCPRLREVSVELEIDGDLKKQGLGEAILADPWQSLVWLANHLSSRGMTLAADQFVMSGTCTGIDPLPPGSAATARFSNLGSVEIRRTKGD